MGSMTSEPLFPLPPSEHRPYVRVVELIGDTLVVALEGVCRACDWKSPHPLPFYEQAWQSCQDHREDVAARYFLDWYRATHPE